MPSEKNSKINTRKVSLQDQGNEDPKTKLNTRKKKKISFHIKFLALPSEIEKLNFELASTPAPFVSHKKGSWG